MKFDASGPEGRGRGDPGVVVRQGQAPQSQAHDAVLFEGKVDGQTLRFVPHPVARTGFRDRGLQLRLRHLV